MPVNVKSEEDGGDWAPVPNPTHVTTSSAAAAVAGKESDDNDDDPIVREVDVYLSPTLADQIYLLQYPLQQTQLNRLPTAARIKPRHAQIELDFPIPVATATNTTIAGGGQGVGSGYCRGAFPFMTRRVFQSQTIPVETHMCLGQLKVDESDYTKSSLHLVPLQHISQMRPSFRHVEENNPDDNNANAADGGQDHNNNKDDDDDDHDYNITSTAEASSEKKPIVFQRKESERAAMIRKSSYAYKKASHDAEEWQDLIVCDATSAEYTSNLNQIVISTFANQQTILAPLHNQENDTDNDDGDTDQDWAISHAGMNYIQSLNYVKVSAQEEMMSTSAATTSSGATAAAAASGSNDIKSIIARMTVLLGNGGPIPYSILRDQFVTSSSSTDSTTVPSTSVSDTKLFQALSICAVLVRGNFCLHSKFLNLSKSMQRARTFLLLLFQRYKTVQKSRLRKIDLQLLLPLEDMNTNSAQQQQQQQQQQVVTLDKLHVLLQQVGKRTNAVVNAVDYNPNINNHATTTAGWVLRVEDNLAFVAAHPQEAEQHLTYWDRLCTSSPRIKKLLEQYNNATTDNDGDIDDDSMKS